MGGRERGIILEKGFVYVLRCNDGKLYIGSTRDIGKRLHSHQGGRLRATKNRRPVQLLYKEELENYSVARKRELYLKTGTGRDWLKNMLERCRSGWAINENGPWPEFSVTY
jgi:putative endonuclease